MSEPGIQDELVAFLIEHQMTIATGESVTAGQVAAALADVPGCSAVLRGGVVAYQAEVKQRLLGVSEAALAAGIVSAAVATALATGAREVLGAQVGIGTTGAAGPEGHDGEPPGSAWVAVAIEGTEARVAHVQASGNRAHVRAAVTHRALELALESVRAVRTDA